MIASGLPMIRAVRADGVLQLASSNDVSAIVVRMARTCDSAVLRTNLRVHARWGAIQVLTTRPDPTRSTLFTSIPTRALQGGRGS